MQTPILVNSRFATRPATGVDRVAAELLRALRDLAQNSVGDAPPISLALPRRGRAHPQGALSTTELAAIAARRGVLAGHVWEQTELALWQPDAWLLSPCNVGPMLRRRQLVIIHDAQPLLFPNSYSTAFRTLYAAVLPVLARRASLLVTVSESSKRDLERTGIAPPDKAQVIPNGADHVDRMIEDPETLQRHGLRPQGFIMAIGSPMPHKNLSTLAAAAAARRPGAPEVVVVGSNRPGPYARTDQATRNGCRWLGRVTDAELKALYRYALALALPSLTEGFGLPALEAMACGCPVVATTAPAVREVCSDTALYADPRDPGQWRSALDEVAENSQLRAHLAAGGLGRAAGFTWRAAAQRYLALMAQTQRTA